MLHLKLSQLHHTWLSFYHAQTTDAMCKHDVSKYLSTGSKARRSNMIYPSAQTDGMCPGGPLCERCVWTRIGPTAFLMTDDVVSMAEILQGFDVFMDDNELIDGHMFMGYVL